MTANRTKFGVLAVCVFLLLAAGVVFIRMIALPAQKTTLTQTALPATLPVTPMTFPVESNSVFFQMPALDPATALLTAANTGRITEIGRFGDGSPYAAAFSPDGTELIVGTGIGVEWRSIGGEKLLRLAATPSPVYAVAFSPDGKLVAAGRQDGRVTVYDADTGKDLQDLIGHSRPVRSLAFSHPSMPRGPSAMLASGSEDGSFYLWDLATGMSLFQFSDPLFGYWGYGIRSLAFSADNQTLATGGDQGYVALWDLQSSRQLDPLKAQSGLLFNIAFSPDGRYLASAAGDGTVKIWDFNSREVKISLSGHNFGAWSVAYSPDGQTLYSGSGDGMIHAWDANTGVLKVEQSIGSGKVDCLQVSPDGNRIAAVIAGESLVLLSGPNLTVGMEPNLLIDGLRSAAFHPAGGLAVLSGENGLIYLWHLARGQALAFGTPHPPNNTGMTAVVSPDGGTLAVGDGLLGTLRLYDTRNLTLKTEEKIAGIRTIAYSSDGKYLAAGGWDLWVFQTATGQSQRISLSAGLTSLAFGTYADLGTTFLAGGLDTGDLVVWNLATGSSSSYSGENGNSIWSVASAKGIIATGDNNGRLVLWRATDGKILNTLIGHTSAIYAMAFSPDGSLLASGGIDGSIRIWNVQTGTRLAYLLGHNGWINSLAFSPDGGLLLSAGSDGSARMWGVRQ